MARDRGSLRACVREIIVFSTKAGAVGLDRLGCKGTNIMAPLPCHSRAIHTRARVHLRGLRRTRISLLIRAFR